MPIDVIVLTDTWLSEENEPNSTMIDGYMVCKKMTKTSRLQINPGGGGVVIAINKNIISSPIYTNVSAVEHMFIKVVVGNIKLI